MLPQVSLPPAPPALIATASDRDQFPSCRNWGAGQPKPAGCTQTRLYWVDLARTVTQAPTTAPAPAGGHQAPANARAAYLETLERVGNRYQACIGKAKEIWGSEYSPEDLAALPELLHTTATTLFIECNRMTR